MQTSNMKGRLWLVGMTSLVLIAFAANPILCRLALKQTAIDPASFTLIRLAAGAATLSVLLRLRAGRRAVAGDWPAALSLFVYAAALSYAYVSLDAGTGALLLFGAVQATMIPVGLAQGERLSGLQVGGYVLALAGLVVLVAPGVTAPSLIGAVLMVGSGMAWGIYSLMGRGGTRPAAATAGNFLRAMTLAAVLSIVTLRWAAWDSWGAGYAVISGALASGIGYMLWYSVLPALRATQAATVQLSVPAITALGGVLFLDEQLTLRLLTASIAILGGIALALRATRPTRTD